MSDPIEDLEQVDEQLDEAKQGKESKATRLVKLALAEGVELFHTPAGEAYATMPIDDHCETWPLKARALRHWLARLYYLATEDAAGSQAVQDACAVLWGMALFDAPEHEVHVRVADHDGMVYLDLGDRGWRAVEIDEDGWRVVADPPVKFRRALGMLLLPEPRPGGSLEALSPLLNCASHDDYRLQVTWLVMAMRPRGPYPVLSLHGEQGSGKSTAAEVLRSMVDPNEAALRPPPRDERDLVIAGSNGHVVALENLSRIDQWLSDALCRIATGSGFATRQLYTDDSETLFSVQRPTILNGITEVVTSGDLQDRSIVQVLPVIEHYTSEADLWDAFELAHPRLLGALLDVVSVALGNEPGVELEEPPRMADYARWTAAATPALGWDADELLSAYANNRANASETVLGSSPLVAPLRRLGDFEGTATGLLEKLVGIVSADDGNIARSKEWPKTPSALSGQLRRLAPNLRRGHPPLGIEFDREGRDGHGNPSGRRVIRIAAPEAP